jgi:hypothetical protein
VANGGSGPGSLARIHWGGLGAPGGRYRPCEAGGCEVLHSQEHHQPAHWHVRQDGAQEDGQGKPMTAPQLTPSQMRQQLPAQHRGKVDAALAEPGVGLALYSDGVERHLCTYGVRGADMPGRFPASMWGTLSLQAYCPAAPAEASRTSPLLQGRDVIPQISRPPSSPAKTQYPYMGVQQVPAVLQPLADVVEEDERRRLLPDYGREAAPSGTANTPSTPPPPASGPLVGAAWWDAHLSKRS